MNGTDVIDYHEDFYDPHRPRTVSTAGLGASLTIAVCGILRIMGFPWWQVLLLAIAGTAMTFGIVVWTRRIWLRERARPAAMRQAIAAIVKQPLPERIESQFWRTVRGHRYKFGKLTEPGPAGRISVNARFLGRIDQNELDEIAADLGRLEGTTYTVRSWKNKPGRLLFIADSQASGRRTDKRAQLQEDFTTAARDVFGEKVEVLFDWDDSEPDELVSVKVLDIDKYHIMSPSEQEKEGRRLAQLLPGAGFKYVPFPAQKKVQFLRPVPVSADDDGWGQAHRELKAGGGSS